jgi:EAL domain-containing protein (putative c-di-GMP-specific phosphodiesterase class I)
MSFGDKLMQQIVSVLQQEYGMNHVFRIGGDKFAVVRREEIETVKILDKLNRILNRTWRVRNAEIEVSACICLVHSGRHGEEDVIHAMDYAMMRAKKMGKGRFLEVDDEIIEDMERRAQIEHALVSAIESKHFEVHYQPIFDTHSKRFHSMEALARLSVPGYGYVSPEEFILVAEQNGTILTVGLLVLEEVCRFIREYDLKQRGIDFIEVNLSVVQCMQERLFEEVTALLKQYDIPPEMINLEITESAEAYSEERLVRNMARLSLTDITFSLDDYGSGYSNINYLVDLPFSIVKIDKYIVWAAMKKVASRRVLENTIAMCKNINLKVVTEGIENPDMMNMVIDMGADYLQGYYFSKPVTRKKVIECLEEGYLEKLLTK